MKWYKFDPRKGSRQKRPPERKYVLVRTTSRDPGCMPEPIAVGYRKDAAGDPQSPYFVVPGHGGKWHVLEWCDCLPDDFEWHSDDSSQHYYGKGRGEFIGQLDDWYDSLFGR